LYFFNEKVFGSNTAFLYFCHPKKRGGKPLLYLLKPKSEKYE